MRTFIYLVAIVVMSTTFHSPSLAVSCYHIDSPFPPGEEFGCTGGPDWTLVELRPSARAIAISTNIDEKDRVLLDREGVPNIECQPESYTATVEQQVTHSLSLGAQTELTTTVEAQLRTFATSLKGQIGCRIQLEAQWNKTEQFLETVTRTKLVEPCSVNRFGLFGQQNDGATTVKLYQWEAACINVVTGETVTSLCDGDFTGTTQVVGTGWFVDAGWCRCGKVYLPCCDSDDMDEQPIVIHPGDSGPLVPYAPIFPAPTEDALPWQPNPDTGYTGQAIADCNLICQ